MVRSITVSDTAFDTIENALNAYANKLATTANGIALPPLVREQARDELVKVITTATTLAINRAALQDAGERWHRRQVAEGHAA